MTEGKSSRKWENELGVYNKMVEINPNIKFLLVNVSGQNGSVQIQNFRSGFRKQL